MNRVTVLLFATLRDGAGKKEIELDLPDGATVADLKTLLVKQFPDLEPAMASTLVSVNREFAFDENVIPEGAEIALFPPVSGG